MAARSRILLVDDEPSIADLVSMYLEREGFRVLQQSTGAGALQAVRDVVAGGGRVLMVGCGSIGQAALPLLRKAEWARIVNVSAHSTKRQSAGLVAYTAAKAMVTSITKNLSQSLAADEILVNTVSPGSTPANASGSPQPKLLSAAACGIEASTSLL